MLSKAIRKAYQTYGKDFFDKMQSRQGQSSLLFGQQNKVDAELPKVSDLKSFRNTQQFQNAKKNSIDEINAKLGQGFDNVNVKADESVIDDNVAEIFDTDVYGSFPTSEMWEDFSDDEIKAMVNEIKGKGLDGEDIIEYFGTMGNIDSSTADLMRSFIKGSD
tara:strand:+ start:489 stop:974 length:486 start_codon:yes stop_codon:yes gene_type:complete